MKLPPLQVLFEDNHLLVVSKPAGLATMGTPPGKPTLLLQAKEYIRERYHKPGNVYLGVVSRLDAPVTGVILLARTSKAARRLTDQFRQRAAEKVYWALVEGILNPAEGECIDWLGHDARHRRMWIVGPTAPDAKEARLSYQRLKIIKGKSSLLQVHLETGRKHQIRLQLAHRGHPIRGDRKYGGQPTWPHGIALHSRLLTITHPTAGEKMTFEAPLPPAWTNYGVHNT